ncbi:MAG: c-type cytochrome [Alphaproteobacteria bacterium]|nr:c-type cytochrome [Alphaproteobacteria bacterium]
MPQSTGRLARQRPRALRGYSCVALIAITLAAVAIGSPVSASMDDGPSILVPDVDAARGRKLFVAKGCVTCHSVNGVGGRAAPALDAPATGEAIDLLGFAARMWRGAAAMQDLQSFELGYRIELSGREIGDLAAFASDPAAQKDFSIDEVPDLLKDWFLDQAYWDEENWPATDEWRFPMEAN